MAQSLLYTNDAPGKHAPSWYAASARPLEEYPAATGDLRFDVTIVGAGFSGVSAALHLSKAGFKVCVIDAHRVGWGASGRNGGQVASGLRIDQEEVESLVGEELAHKAFGIGVEAAETVRQLIKSNKIECAYKDGVIEAFHKARYDKYGQQEVDHLRSKYKYDSVSFLSPGEMREKVGSHDYSAGVLDTRCGHLHPLNYVRGLARAAAKAGTSFFEMSEVKAVKGGRPAKVTTANAEIKSDWVVLACNGYLGNLDRQVADRVMPINNFIIATEPLDEAMVRSLIRDGEAVADSRFVVNYFRVSEDGRMLFGGGENYSYQFPKDIQGMVRRCMLKIYPQLENARVDYAWGGTLAITYRRLPHFEMRDDGLINISGYSGSGVAMATMAGKLVSEAIAGQMERFDIMRNLPTPKFPGGALLRWPLLPLALTWYAMRDRL